MIQFSKPLQHVSTLMRQLVFDLVFMAENIILLGIALNSDITELQENPWSFAVVLLGFSFVGLILKCVYYRYLHIWAWLIMDYITTTEDGHWKCIIFSNMYLCGDLKERELLLCCIPSPIFKFFNYLTKDRCGSCNLCTVVASIFILPFVFGLALLAVVISLILMVAFLPVFLILILPCVIFMTCKQSNRSDNIIKILDTDSKGTDEDVPLAEKLLAPMEEVVVTTSPKKSCDRSTTQTIEETACDDPLDLTNGNPNNSRA